METSIEAVDVDGKFRISLPVGMAEVDEHGIDSDVYHWVGESIEVRIDHGLFSDPLTSYAGYPDYELTTEAIDGHLARIISFHQYDGSLIVAAHFHDLARRRHADLKKLTVVIQSSLNDGDEISKTIVRSIKFQGVLP